MVNILNHFLVNFFLFCLGLFGIILNRQNIIIVLMSIELSLLSINLNFIYSSINIGLEGVNLTSLSLTNLNTKADGAWSISVRGYHITHGFPCFSSLFTAKNIININ